MCVCVCGGGCVESPYVVRQNYLGTACVCVSVCVCELKRKLLISASFLEAGFCDRSCRVGCEKKQD
jgi:hypothetical protein